MALVVDASVALKWVLQEPDSADAERLARSDERLLLPDFWLSEATNVLWLQVRKGLWTPERARAGLSLLQEQIEPTPTGGFDLHGAALEIGLTVRHSTYDTMYVAFAVAVGATHVIAADRAFIEAMGNHHDHRLANLVISLETWVGSRNLAG